MATQYLDTVWLFDGGAFGADVTAWKRDNQLTWEEVAQLTGHYESDGGVSLVGRGYTPSIDGFIALCNLCDLNPMHYWTVAV